jgi:transcriptional regulator with XRE-family HTH domain
MRENLAMNTKQKMADRLNNLMRLHPDLDTLEKIEERSGVSYNTVRRIRKPDSTNVSIQNVEDVAKVFGLTLAEFVGDPGNGVNLSPEEFTLLKTFRELDAKDRSEIIFFAQMKKARPKGLLG